GIGRDAVPGDRMVGGEHDSGRGPRSRQRCSLQSGELHGNLLQQAETPAGFGEVLLARPGELRGGFIERRDDDFHGLHALLKSTPTMFPAMKLLTIAWSSSSGRMFQGFDPSPVLTSATSIFAGSFTDKSSFCTVLAADATV